MQVPFDYEEERERGHEDLSGCLSISEVKSPVIKRVRNYLKITRSFQDEIKSHSSPKVRR